MNRLSKDPGFDRNEAITKVTEQLEWIAKSGVDAILVTCTNYIALLDEQTIPIAVPVIKIDEPLFKMLCMDNASQILFFTNPATVDGTMRRLAEYGAAIGASTRDIEARVIDGAFELIMQGNKAEYELAVTDSIRTILATEGNKRLTVAQLSMVDAAVRLERELQIEIGNPLRSLALRMEALIL